MRTFCTWQLSVVVSSKWANQLPFGSVCPGDSAVTSCSSTSSSPLPKILREVLGVTGGDHPKGMTPMTLISPCLTYWTDLALHMIIPLLPVFACADFPPPPPSSDPPGVDFEQGHSDTIKLPCEWYMAVASVPSRLGDGIAQLRDDEEAAAPSIRRIPYWWTLRPDGRYETTWSFPSAANSDDSGPGPGRRTSDDDHAAARLVQPPSRRPGCRNVDATFANTRSLIKKHGSSSGSGVFFSAVPTR